MDFLRKKMKKIIISERLKKIISCVTPGHRIADIGTDHAYIPIVLVKNSISPYAIACDINKGPIDIAKKQIFDQKLESLIECRQGDGLSPISNGEVDAVVIAGMGGIQICEILNKNIDLLYNVDSIILQPMNAQKEVREFLINNNFYITKEVLAKEDRRIYQIIVAAKGNSEAYNALFLECGKLLFEEKDPLLKELIENKIQKEKEIINNTVNRDSISSKKALKTAQKRLNVFLEGYDDFATM
jgi:tRNA (adenine22-N1)-methyltransferase